MWFMDVTDRNNMPICTKSDLWMWGWDVKISVQPI